PAEHAPAEPASAPPAEHAPAEPASAPPAEPAPTASAEPGAIPMAEVRWRQRAKVAGRVKSVQVQPWGDTPRLTVTLVDDTGGITLIFGRRQVAGVITGARLTAEGMVSQVSGHLAIFNPQVSLLGSESAPPEGDGDGG
ncbi:MAG: OB-fold nucleic acid binding domain-containing protein, partial [Acidimicrobiales bacterium]